MPETTLEAVRLSAVEGRLSNPYYRKSQLKKLHDTIRSNSEALQNAIQHDSGHTAAEVKVQYWLTVQSLEIAYHSIDPNKCLEDEYSVARGNNAPFAEEPVGVAVIIEPARHTYVYSLISALAPALAAGNVIVNKTEQTLKTAPSLIHDLIVEALDAGLYYRTTRSLREDDLSFDHVKVYQSESPRPSGRQLLSCSNKLAVAIVERDAALESTAASLLRARFGLNGTSPYAPDIVLVNEWIKDSFLKELKRAASSFPINIHGGDGKAPLKTARSPILDKLSETGDANIEFSSSAGKIIYLSSREQALSGRKISESLMIVHSTSSMDDAIDSVERIGPLAALYTFTSPVNAKYLAQFIDCDGCFINHIPTHLLYSPTAPENSSLSLDEGGVYQQRLFKRPKPRFQGISPLDGRLSRVLSGCNPEEIDRLDNEISRPLPDMRRPNKKNIGFFEQGIITGLIITLATVVSGVTIAGYCIYHR